MNVAYPIFSVIVPVYDVEPYLRDCLNSILAQTFRDFELILVDDGSPDKCGGICDEYATCDDRIKVCHLEHCGVAQARNFGMEQARGEYVTFVDGDDVLFADALEYWQRQMSGNGLDILVEDESLAARFEDVVELNLQAGSIGESRVFESGAELAKFLLPAKRNSSTWGKCYRRAILTAEHRFPAMEFAEDLVFFSRFFRGSFRCQFDPSSHYGYRHRLGQISGAVPVKKIFGEVVGMAELVRIMSELGFARENLAELLRLHSGLLGMLSTSDVGYSRFGAAEKRKFEEALGTISRCLGFFPYGKFAYVRFFVLRGHMEWLWGSLQRFVNFFRHRKECDNE